MPLNLLFMGTPEFALPALDALVNSEHRIVAVYTAPPRPAGRGNKLRLTPVHQYALAHNLKVHTPATLKDASTQSEFDAYQADAAIVAAYGLLLPKAILNAPRLGCINIHPSLLPRWRGAAPIQRTIMAADTETGVVIMRMDTGLDTGDMLLVEHFTIPEGTTGGELHDRLAKEAAPLMIRTLAALEKGSIVPQKQAAEGITYAHKITREDCRIDWKRPAAVLRQQILGLSPHPGAFFTYKNEAIKIWQAEIVPSSSTHSPGTVMETSLLIRCGENALRPLLIQRPGKNPMQTADMLRGYPIAVGEMLQ